MPPLSLPPIIGHRCARASAPENTLAGLRRAAGMGVRWVEVDVRLTADGIPVLLHDETLDRTTNGQGALADTTVEVLRRLDAGSWFDPAFAGETVPLLAEFLLVASDYGIGVNLELKGDCGDPNVLAALALTTAASVWPGHKPPPLISSFDLPCLETAARIAPDWPRGLLLERIDQDWAGRAAEIDAACIIIDHESITGAESVAALGAGGRPVLTYTVNDPGRARYLYSIGITAVITDRPDAGINNAVGVGFSEKYAIHGYLMTAPAPAGYDVLPDASGRPCPLPT
ncbi:MAG: glycerophosphodiester phosphodiesterase family protein [Rhodospirillaceae bacterium]